MELWTALLLGFFGSFHCVGMCGPLAMSLPRKSSGFLHLTSNAVIYNTGRILTYSTFGLIFGLLGTQITIAGFQGTLSILLGTGIVLGVILTRSASFKRSFINQYLFIRISALYGKLLRKESVLAFAGMGVLNGLLPCAFVYSGLAAAVLTQTPAHSAVYMSFFGIGTFPAMFLMYLSPSVLSLDLRNSVRKMVPYLAFGLGLFLIIRGIALQDLHLAGVLSESMETFCVFPGTQMN